MTLPAPPPLTISGGGGGGLSAEADQAWLIDTGNSDTIFLRRYTRDTNGAVTGTTDTQADGTTAYVETGPSVPIADPSQYPGLLNTAQFELMMDTGNNNELFLRRYRFTNTGGLAGAVDFELDGLTVYSGFVGPERPVGASLGGPELVVTANRRVAGDSPVAVAAGAEKVIVLAVAEDVSVNGAAIPANIGVTFGSEGYTTDALTVTIAGSGDALIIEERAA